MKQFFVILASISFVALTACNKVGMGPKPSLDSDDDKTVYAIGMDMGSKLKTLQLSKKEMSILKMGIDDGAEGKKGEVEPREFLSKVGDLIRKRQQAFAEKEKGEAQKFLDIKPM